MTWWQEWLSARKWRLLGVFLKYGLVLSLCFNVLLIFRWLEPRYADRTSDRDIVFSFSHRPQNLTWKKSLISADLLDTNKKPFYVVDQMSNIELADDKDKTIIGKKEPIVKAKRVKQLLILKRVKERGTAIFVFSAVFGNSSSSASWDRLVLQGWQAKKYTENVSCCIQFNNGVLQSYAAKTLFWTLRPDMIATQFICSVTTIAGNWPKSVGLVPEHSECHTFFNWYLAPAFSYRHENQIAVCAKLAYGELSADDILSWFEVHRRLGVNKVLAYTYHLNSAATRVLQHYQAIGLAQVFPFELPYTDNGNRPEVGVKNAQAWSDEQICVYDCLERLRGYKYVLTIDFDEFLVPRREKTLGDLFDKLFREKTYASGFHFLTQLHITSWGVTSNGSKFKAGQYVNSTRAMSDRLKHVVRPERLVEGGLTTHGFWNNHMAGYKKFRASADDAVLHHFRSCRKDWARRNITKCIELPRIRDTTVADFMADIEPAVLDLRKTILGES